MSRVLVVAPEAVGGRMAGPAIRSWELSATLAGANRVTLAAPAPLPPAGPAGVSVVEARASILASLAGRVEVVLAQPSAYARFPALRAGPACRVVDLYDPSVIEDLEIHRDLRAAEQVDRQHQDLAELRTALALGDYFVCASEVQRALWLGFLTTAGRVNAANYRRDRTLRSLIDLCPFGVPATQPPAGSGILRRHFPEIDAGDLVAVWAGGIWNWFDPLTLLRGVALAVRDLPRLRVVFLGAGHPEPGVPAMAMEAAAHDLSRQLGLTGRHVFFNDRWLPYAERGAYLRDASFAVSLHFDTVETTFAFRTRLLDHLWAGLPTIATTGDELGDAIAAAGAGLVVEPGNVEQVGAALIRLADQDLRATLAARALALREEYRWPRVAERLSAFCASPSPAPDRRARTPGTTHRASAVRGARRAWSVLRREGPVAFARRVGRTLDQRLR